MSWSISRNSRNECGVDVVFDDEIFLLQQYGGISKYFSCLISALEEDRALGVSPRVDARVVRNEYIKSESALQSVFDSLPAVFSRRPLLQLTNLASSILGGQSSDIVHQTYYRSARWIRNGACSVITIHDLIPEMYPGWVSSVEVRQAKSAAVKRADGIAVVSGSTLKDLNSVYGDLDCPVVVTPLGVSESFFLHEAEIHCLQRTRFREAPYLLFVGRRGGYKDFKTCASAFADLSTIFPDLTLVCVGGGDMSDHELEMLLRLRIADRVEVVNVKEVELPYVYRDAEAFVFSSRYEGFGLPTLEAMAAGCPAVVTDVPALREVGGNASLRFDPGSVDSLGAALLRVLEDSKLATELRRDGLSRAREFCWSRTASATVDLYRQVLGCVT